MHTMAKVKNANLALGDCPEPAARTIGEEQVVAESDRLIASTRQEAHELVELYGADPAKVVTVAPGVDLERFRPGSRVVARTRLGLRQDAVVLAFVGRIQPLKAPDVVLRAAARLVEHDPALRERLVVLVVGGASGSGLAEPAALAKLAGDLGISDLVRFEPPADQVRLADIYRAATVTLVPSHNESFGLVAVESQACGTPVVAAAVGGLVTAVRDGYSGVLVDGHDPDRYASVLSSLLAEPRRLRTYATGAAAHAASFSWQRTADGLLTVYRDAMAAQNRRLALGVTAV
jgi:D-inositol-3-phosphate glycosyltransferase